MTLGGTLFIYNGISMDYCFLEAVKCLRDLCDYVVVLDAGSDDGTQEALQESCSDCSLVLLDGADWAEQKGKEKLNYFSNMALDQLVKARPDIDYHINLQGDEIIHQDSFPFIRQAMETNASGFLNRRYNLWKDPYHMLNVVQSRKPCSSEIIRLAKPQYRSIGDAESLAIDPPLNIDFLDRIEFFHMGFVRDPTIMKRKVVHMQEEVFGMDHDKKLDLSDKFEPLDYFSEDDLVPIRKPLPIYVRQWAQERYPNIK